jgi:hypothetical protein
VLAGCGADAEPKFEADPSPTAPTSASPTPDEQDEREPWQERSPDGAIAFAKHWTAVFSESFQTGDTNELASISASECSGCAGFIDLIREVYDSGGSISGKPWRLLNAGWSSPDNGQSAVAVTGKMVIPAQTIDRADEAPSNAKPITEIYIFTVSWRDGAWTTTSLARQA